MLFGASGLSRRGLMSAGAGLAFGGLARLAHAQSTPAEIQAAPYTNEVYGYGPLRTDPFAIFDLPEGFSYTVVSRAGEAMSDGLVTPYKMDGMGCFAAGRDRVALVRNHELKPADADYGAFGVSHVLAGKVPAARVYDSRGDGRFLPGGTTTLIYDLRRRRLEASWLSLAGSSTNCAGGRTPWGSWLTCEEVVAPDRNAVKSHGWVFEVPSAGRGLVEPVPLTAMGRFRHEAAAVDPATGVIYLTEDDYTGSLFYRFLPNDRTAPAKGGRLQALGLKPGQGNDTRNWTRADWSQGEVREVVWIDLEGVDNTDGTLAARGAAKGAAWFARGEGVFFGDGELYFTCTTGGPAKLGQIMRYRPSPMEGRPGEANQPGRLQLFLQPTDKSVLFMGDNIAVSPWGHLIVCEDKEGGVNFLKAVTPEGKVYAIGRQAQPLATDVKSNSELAGCCFSPDGTTLFVNIYWPGLTLAITGPWSRIRT